LTTDAGTAFPSRELVVFLTFSVILATVVGQGLTLPKLIDVLDMEDDSHIVEKEEIKARIHAAEAALARLEELVNEEWVREDTAERVRALYGFRRSRFLAQHDDEDDGLIEQRSSDYRRLMRELIEAERAAVRALRRERRISDDVMRLVERDLDLEEARLE
jgi:CPA1 family monovalent cation:H+ antiporter